MSEQGSKQAGPDRLPSIGYWVIVLGGMVLKATQQALAPFEVAPTEFLILHQCFRKEANTVTELAGISPLDVSAMSRQVERLRDRGLLRRRRSTDDRRVVFLELTEEGRLLLYRLYRVAEAVEEKIVQNLGSEEKESLMASLRKLTIDLEESRRLFES